MHRIISMNCAAVNSLKRLTTQRCVCAEHRLLWTAALQRNNLLANKFRIQQIGQVECIRTQTTTPSADVASRKRKRRKFRGSRFVELLQVTDKATKQIKTKVENLKAGNLSEFVLTSNLPSSKKTKKKDSPKKETKTDYQPIEYQKVNLEMLENSNIHSEIYDERPLIFFGKEVKGMKAIEINEILKSFNNFKEIIETIKDEYSEEMDYRKNRTLAENKIDDKLDDIEAAMDAIDLVPVKTKAQTGKKLLKKDKQQKYKSKIHVSQEQESLAKHKSLFINLNSYLHVCTSVGVINRGLSLLLMYRQKYKKAGLDPRMFNIEPYNILLNGYAETGNYDKIREIIVVLKEDSIPLNHQSFAAIFECLGRLDPTENNLKLIQKYKENAKKMGISMNDILDKSLFQYDQREIVLDAIQRVEPDFEPIYTPPVLTYSNQLLKKLNQHVNDPAASNFEAKKGEEIMNSKKGFTKKQLQAYARKQLRIELEGCLTVNSVEDNKDVGANTELCKKRWEELQTGWRSTICAAINRDMTILRAQTKYKPQSYMTCFTYLKTLEPAQYADILLKEIRMLAEGSETYSPTVNQLYRALGQKVYAKFQIEQKKKNGVLEKVGEIYARYLGKWEKCNTSDNPRQMWQRIVHENQHWGPSMNLEEKPWPNSALLGIGRFLYNILMRDIKIDSNITKPQNKSKHPNLLPAFYTLFRNQGKNVKEEVKPHPILSRLLRSSRQKTLTFDANMVPMLCPPQPWSTPVNGGYLLTNTDLIRLPQQAMQQWDRIKSCGSQELYPALDSLNQLASIPWKVNTDVLDVILEVFKNGGNDKLDVPQPPSSLPPLPSITEKNSDMTSAERYQMFRQKMFHRRKQAEMYSLWCDTLYRLSLANHYRDKVFWLPHNMDFRGRVYPVPPHLNHLGSDLARSILVFDQAQPLGTDGFSWLKLHCINLTGLKKRDSIRERLLYAEEVMDDIIDSAENPLTGRKWWTKSDEPWQTLSCCMEIAKVRKCPEPEKYMCHLPIHQDGSCNGLQHYAALGRDKAGAISVNLAPSRVPQDVYSAVAALVEKSRQTDAENGLHVAQILNGYVRRKVIKQTVMTTVYGVTRYGARLQIAKQLKDIDEFPKEWVWPASTYLTTKTFESLREMFTSTKEIQDWFTECARMISTICGQNVEWVTPLGLPVVQPYSRHDSKRISPKDGKNIKEKIHMDMYEKPNVMKQKNAFPPNFIHSLDSSHMMLTSLYCERKGLTFVSVHDCYWTHACTVPDMNKICREQFVALHSEPILEDLSKFLIQKYSFSEKTLTNDRVVGDMTKRNLNSLLKNLPEKGNFDLKNVLNSVYFFS